MNAIPWNKKLFGAFFTKTLQRSTMSGYFEIMRVQLFLEPDPLSNPDASKTQFGTISAEILRLELGHVGRDMYLDFKK